MGLKRGLEMGLKVYAGANDLKVYAGLGSDPGPLMLAKTCRSRRLITSRIAYSHAGDTCR
jgi:hypothetical protein